MLRGLVQLILLVIIVALLYEFLTRLGTAPFGINLNNFNLSNLSSITGVFNNRSFNLSYPGLITPPPNNVPQNQTLSYTLGLINNDRNTFGLPNVSYSNESSAQQHADSMLMYHYFSHWDPYGLKPYMRYTLLNQTQGVDENVAYIYNSSGVNVLNALKKMEYDMMYNDAQCCDNGHKFNILSPQHNEVSIGVAYNRTTIYLVEDFINYYIGWVYGTPSFSNGAVNLKGSALSGYYLSTVEISYDPPITNMTRGQLDNTSTYSLGQQVAGVGHRTGTEVYTFPNLTTINATTYETQGSSFDVSFNMNKLIQQYGPGEYTVLVFLTNSTGQQQNYCYTDNGGIQHCNDFLASTYTFFINSTGQQYTPPYV